MDDVPVRFSTGRGRTQAAGAVVLKPVGDEAEASRTADLAPSVEQHGFRLARPIAAGEGRWIR